VRFITLPILASLAFIGAEHRNEIVDLYRAAYPVDPLKREALEECARNYPNFNRLDTIDRDRCYAGIPIGRSAATALAASPYYNQSPSQLPVTDIRRQEATVGHRRVRQIASGTPVGPK
jgi:hypothetical protein